MQIKNDMMKRLYVVVCLSLYLPNTKNSNDLRIKLKEGVLTFENDCVLDI